MTTPSTCRLRDARRRRRSSTAPRVAPRRSAVLGCLLAVVLIVTSSGCGYTGGKILYALGFGSTKKVEAQFVLTQEPLLIFVDDEHDRVTWPTAQGHLTDSLSQELLRTKATKRIVPFATLQNHMQADPRFAERSCREIGELCGADQVLWLRVDDFLVEEEYYDPHRAAYATVSVKAIDVKWKDKEDGRPRLWPGSPEGHMVTVALTGSEVLRLETREEITRELCSVLAVKVAKLFYEHRLEDFEKEE